MPSGCGLCFLILFGAVLGARAPFENLPYHLLPVGFPLCAVRCDRSDLFVRSFHALAASVFLVVLRLRVVVVVFLVALALAFVAPAFFAVALSTTALAPGM